MPKNIFEFKTIWSLKNNLTKCLKSTDSSVIELWARRKLFSLLLHYRERARIKRVIKFRINYTALLFKMLWRIRPRK